MAFVTSVIPLWRRGGTSIPRCRNGQLGPLQSARQSALQSPRANVRATFGDSVAQPETLQAENDVVEASDEAPYDPSGMTVEQFFLKSLGEWRSQRSSHNLAWTQFEAITSDITIAEMPVTDPAVKELCDLNNVDPGDVVTSIEMSWVGESDWDDDQEVKGCVLMSVVKDTETTGRLLRSKGYAEEIPAVGNWVMTSDGAFVLNTLYEAAAAEERIWFATPDLRLRVSNIRTSSGRGVVTASFSSEIRSIKR
jgi:phycoerythrin-associated linker protein